MSGCLPRSAIGTGRAEWQHGGRGLGPAWRRDGHPMCSQEVPPLDRRVSHTWWEGAHGPIRLSGRPQHRAQAYLHKIWSKMVTEGQKYSRGVSLRVGQSQRPALTRFYPFGLNGSTTLAPTVPPSRTPPTLRSPILDRNRAATLPLSHCLTYVHPVATDRGPMKKRVLAPAPSL